jgi:hypothetical protein
MKDTNSTIESYLNAESKRMAVIIQSAHPNKKVTIQSYGVAINADSERSLKGRITKKDADDVI